MPRTDYQANVGVYRLPDKIGLLWETGPAHDQDGYLLSNSAAGGITLSEAGTANVWPAIGDLAENIDPVALINQYLRTY